MARQLVRKTPFEHLDVKTKLDVPLDFGTWDEPEFTNLLDEGLSPKQAQERLNKDLPFQKLKYKPQEVFKNPLAQSEALIPQQTKVKNWDEDKYNEIVDFISTYRGDNVPLGDIQNQLLEDYGSDYEDLVRYALDKWAE